MNSARSSVRQGDAAASASAGNQFSRVDQLRPDRDVGVILPAKFPTQGLVALRSAECRQGAEERLTKLLGDGHAVHSGREWVFHVRGIRVRDCHTSFCQRVARCRCAQTFGIQGDLRPQRVVVGGVATDRNLLFEAEFKREN